MTVPTNKSISKLKSRINGLSYAAYAASGGLFLMAYISFVGAVKPELNAGIGITLAVLLVFITSYMHKTLALSIDAAIHEATETMKKERSRIAHDIRNSLAVIKMDAETSLLKEGIPDEIREALVQFNSEADKINSILS